MNTSKQVNMMVGLLMVFLVGTLLYFLWDDDRASEAESRQLFTNAERGGALYSLNCRSCHGLTGTGPPGSAASCPARPSTATPTGSRTPALPPAPSATATPFVAAA